MNPFKHKHWVFIACDEMKDGNFLMGAEVTVNDAQDEEEAFLEVKKIITRKIYSLRKVYECTQCFYSDRQARAIENLVNHHHE